MVQKTNSENSPRYYKDWKSWNIEGFKQDFVGIDWKNFIKPEKRDPDYSFNQFYIKLQNLIEVYVPLKRLSNKQLKYKSKPWITQGIKKSMQKRDRLLRKFMKEKRIDERSFFYERYRQYRNRLVNIIRQSKRIYYKNYFQENLNNSKKMWDGIGEIISKKRTKDKKNISLKINNNVLSDQKLIAETFNNHFTNIAGEIQSKIRPTKVSFKSFLKRPCRRSFFFSPITPEEVRKTLTSLDPKKSSGPHSIPRQILDAVQEEITIILSDIFNITLQTGKFISTLKLVKVVPIYKNKGSPFETGNFRPISLLSNIEKLFEKLIHKRMMEFVDQNKLTFERQFGFRSKHSTVHSLITITEEIKKAIDKGEYTCGVFIDFEKAFDTVDHNILLKKLEHYGFRGITNDWFKSYLSDRKQFVTISGHESDHKNIIHGVPQGSVLGPILFILYINDLSNAIIYSRTFNFADDTAILYSGINPKQIKKRVNIDLKILLKWLKANKIQLNIAKTEVILFKQKQKSLTYDIKIKLDGKRMRFTKYTKYLGILIDENLSMAEHTESIAKKLRKTNGAISNYVPINLLRSIYFALFHPHAHYGLQIWAQNLSPSSRVTKLQKKAVCLMTFSKINSSSKPLFLQTNIMTIKEHVFILNTKLAYQILNSTSPIAIQQTLNI